MKICLINPPIYVLKKDVIPLVPPIGLACLAAALRVHGHDVIVIDIPIEEEIKKRRIYKIQDGKKMFRYGDSVEVLQMKIESIKPDVVGISSLMSANEHEALECARAVKGVSRDIIVIVGGVNATVRSREILSDPHVDYVIAGEGDDSLPEFLDRIKTKKGYEDLTYLGYKSNGNVVIPSNPSYVLDLDKLPIPAWDLLPLNKYLKRPFPFPSLKSRTTVMITSRGCIMNCVFCSGKKFLGNWRGRSPEHVHAEIQMLKKVYGVEDIQFMDANINVHKERFLKIIEIMKKEGLSWNPVGGLFINALEVPIVEKMIESGCYYLTLAVEHGSPEMQRYIGKINPIEKVQRITKVCRENGVWTHAPFVIGFPDEKKEDTMQCIEYAKKSGVDSISVFHATPLPGSRLYQEIKSYINYDMSEIRLLGDHCVSKNITKEDLILLRKMIMRSFLLFKILDVLRYPFKFYRKLIKNNYLYSKILVQNIRRFIIVYFK